MKSTVDLFLRQCRRECLLHIRHPRMLVFSSLFFLMIIVFFPMTLTPNPTLLREVFPGLIWTALLLALLLACERLFQQDYEDGVIEQWLVSGESLQVIVFCKLGVQWLLTLSTFLLLCPFFALLFHLSFNETMMLMLCLMVGTPAMLFLCALAASFCVSMSQKGVLIALILLPLALPVMIFGSGTLSALLHGLPINGHLAFLLALSLLSVSFLPMAIAAIIRMSLVD